MFEIHMVNLIKHLKSLHRIIPTFNAEFNRKRNNFFKDHETYDFYDVPIFIISFNRLSYLKGLIENLEQFGYKNIKIIDNASTYEPLLDYYNNVPYEVFRLNRNLGHMAFWKDETFDRFKNDLYVVTDPDLEIPNECPSDFIKVFYSYLMRYPRIKKAGFSLKIDDIPEAAPLYEDVQKWEKPYASFKIPGVNAYASDIDTTFALYMPDSLNAGRHFITAVRVGYPYQIRHLPWYKNSQNPTDEDIYYERHRTNGFWNSTTGCMTNEGKNGMKSGWTS